VHALDSSISHWQRQIYAHTDRPAFQEGLTVTGPTPELIAKALIQLLQCHKSHKDFNPPDGITCEKQPELAFIQQFHRIRMYILFFFNLIPIDVLFCFISGSVDSEAQRGFGLGPTRSVIRAGVQYLVQQPIFGNRGDYYHLTAPLFSLASRDELCWAAGFWSALHMVFFGLTPDPISPWIFYAIIYGKSGLPTTVGSIRALDPVSADILQAWFDFSATDTFGANDIYHPVHGLLITYLDISDVRKHFIHSRLPT
jgi:hypothetical protein